MSGKETKIVIAGFGGQGVVVTGTVLAKACVIENKQVTQMVSYGAEMRGGTANASVIVSDEQIASPVIERPDAAIILNQPSLDKFESLITGGGLAVLNSSMVERQVERDDLDVVTINATQIALALGNIRVANIVALGAFIEKTNIVTMAGAQKAIEDFFGERKPKLIEINKEALRQGAQNSNIAEYKL